MNELTGSVLMGAAILWLAVKTLRGVDSGTVEFGIGELCILAACWMAGRVIADKGLFDLLAG